MKVFSYTQPFEADVVDAFCQLQKGFTDQFVYYEKSADAPLVPARMMGLGRCIAVASMAEVEACLQGPAAVQPVLFTFRRFDAENPAPADPLMQCFPRLRFMVPEVVLIQNERGTFLQVNSLGPVYEGRVARFVRQAAAAPIRTRETIPFTLEYDSHEAWNSMMCTTLNAIKAGRINKAVLSRRLALRAAHPFSSKDLLVNLIDGPARGTVIMYRYGDVFFCGCTPELLVRKRGTALMSDCLAGTCPTGDTPQQQHEYAQALLADDKNRREHAFVVDFIRSVVERNCYNVDIPTEPGIRTLPHVQHLHTPVRAHMMEGRSVQNLAGQLSPTPALAGTPVGEAMMLLRQVEPYNRGFFGGSVGYVDTAGDGAFSVAIRSGVFDGEMGYVYAGCGIVEGSDAAAEYDEIDLKLQTILSAFDGGQTA